jgi:hypothetical protein
MYQQYVSAARVAQYQQQCLQEAAMERSMHVARQTPPTTPARVGARTRILFAASWLHRRLIGPAASQ